MRRTLREAIEWLKQNRAKCRAADLLKAMSEQGCEYRKTKDGWIIWHEQVAFPQTNVANPHGKAKGNAVKSAYVKGCWRLLEALEDLKNDRRE